MLLVFGWHQLPSISKGTGGLGRISDASLEALPPKRVGCPPFAILGYNLLWVKSRPKRLIKGGSMTRRSTQRRRRYPLQYAPHLLLASLVIVTTSAAFAQYEKQVEYLQNLRSPLRPTGDQCRAMSAAFSDATRKLNEAHDKCLNSGGSQPSGKTCSKASCQNLHTLRDYSQERSAAESKVCNERARLVEAEQREWDAQVRASQEAHRQQVQQAQQYQRQLEEAQHGSIRAAAASAPPTPKSDPTVTAGQVSEIAETIETGAEYLEGAGSAQEAAGQAIKRDKSIRGPVRNSIGDKMINSSKGKVAIGKAVGAGATIVDTGAKLADGDYGGVAENAIEHVFDRVASAWCAQAGPAAAGCEAVYIGGKIVGQGINAATKAVTGTSMRDHVTDIYYERANNPDWQYDYLEERTGIPADNWKSEAADAARQPVSPNATAPKAATCSTLANEPARQQLAQSDRARYLELWNSCNKK